MILSEHQLRVNFANRLSDLRRAAGMTQLELAQKLNYSDKSISKWERAEGVPDLYVAHQIADIFEVSVDYLLSDKPFRKPIFSRNKLIITLLSMAAPWLLATALNWILGIFFPSLPLWRLYIYAIPVTAIIALVFSCIWWKKIWRFLSVSAIIWSVPTCVFTSFTTRENAFIYIVAAVVQVMAVMGFLIKKQKSPPKIEENEK
ncbi:MAG: helix-turn-helix transcriptional regulator [Ruminococcaceae bacterium]|nr:helix-turn-helix transcriptional regulator [Oscillospiraceae bacterium]